MENFIGDFHYFHVFIGLVWSSIIDLTQAITEPGGEKNIQAKTIRFFGISRKREKEEGLSGEACLRTPIFPPIIEMILIKGAKMKILISADMEGISG
ncbi:MAG: hypothetical protein IMZ50_07685, partial [Candidatus Atribacteria bacterium]|nr:hypothetical protein [Candidatus Atribacteria bacterium]